MSKMTVTKEFRFEGAHSLPGYQGSCSNLHGHSWVLLVEVSGDVNKTSGMIMDFSKLKKIVNTLIVDKLDHSHLNDLYVMPTAELMVMHFADTLIEPLRAVGVELETVLLYETPSSVCTWRR